MLLILTPPYLWFRCCFLEASVSQRLVTGKIVHLLLADAGQFVVSPCAFPAPVPDPVWPKSVASAAVLAPSCLATSSGVFPEGPVGGWFCMSGLNGEVNMMMNVVWFIWVEMSG